MLIEAVTSVPWLTDKPVKATLRWVALKVRFTIQPLTIEPQYIKNVTSNVPVVSILSSLFKQDC